MNDKSELDRIIQAGICGEPELKKEEKKRFLGNFRERVLKVLTKKQVEEKGTYQEVLKAIQDPRAKRLVVTNKVKMASAMEYIKMARQNNVKFTMVDGDNYTGDIGLVVAGDTAVDEKDVYV